MFIFLFLEHLIPDHSCNYVAEQSSTYGGEDYFSWHSVFSVEQCHSLCSRTRECDRVTYSGFQSEKKCLMYREKEFKELTEVYSMSWTKECPGGKCGRFGANLSLNCHNKLNFGLQARSDTKPGAIARSVAMSLGNQEAS